MAVIRRHITSMVFVLIFSGLFPVIAQADVIETQPLKFGKWAVTNNSAPRFVTVDIDGSYTNSPELIMLEAPQPGIYQVTDLPAFANIVNVSVIMQQPMQGSGGEIFTMDGFQTLCPPADDNGVTFLTLGATAETSGSNNAYTDGVYSGDLYIEVSF